MAQTSLRSIIGKSDLDDLLSNREKLNQGLELMIDSPAVGWGVQIDRVEIKDVSLPETMKRSMARQAEADRERRARVINADAELQASKKLAEAAEEMSEQPAALQLRLLQTVVAVAAEKNSTLVLPFPVELLRFLERAQQPEDAEGTAAETLAGPSRAEAALAAAAGEPETAAHGRGAGRGAEQEVAPTFRPAARGSRGGTAASSAAPFGGPLPPDPSTPLGDPAMTLPELQVTGLPTAEDVAARHARDHGERRQDEGPQNESRQKESSHSGRSRRRHPGKGA